MQIDLEELNPEAAQLVRETADKEGISLEQAFNDLLGEGFAALEAERRSEQK